MKKSYIILILLLAVSIGGLILSLSNNSTYSDFTEAFEHPGKEFHVVGKRVTEMPEKYDPQNNPDQFEFYLADTKNKQCKVILKRSKPQDFEKSEQIVLIGEANGNEFVAKEILLKCPSKYNNGTPQATTGS